MNLKPNDARHTSNDYKKLTQILNVLIMFQNE